MSDAIGYPTVPGLIESGRFEEAENVLKRESDKCIGRGENLREMTLLYEKWAKACYISGDFASTLKKLELCLKSGCLRRDAELKIRVLRIHLHRRMGNENLAMSELREAEEKYKSIGDPYERNWLLNEREITGRKTVLKSFPSHMTVRLTNRCQLRCVMCGMGIRKPWDIPKETVNEIISFLPYLEDLQWQGGEVFFLNREILSGLITRAAAYLHLRQSIITNGLLIDREWAKILVSGRINIRYSIDGATGEIYEKIRRNAKFEDLLKSVDIMNGEMGRQNRRIPFSIHMVVMKSNYRKIEQMIDFAQAHGFDTVALSPMTIDESNPENLFSGKDEKMWDELQKQRLRAKEKALKSGICFEDSLPLPPNSKKDGQNQQTKERKEKNPQPIKTPGIPQNILFCLSPWKRIIIREGGPVIPNFHCGERQIGHISQNSLLEIWNGEEMKKLREGILKRELEGLCTSYCLSGALMDTWRDQMEWNWG